MKEYLSLLTDTLHGVEKSDRTGTGTYSVFGRQIRFDLSKGFPLLTTKKLHWKSIVGELLWFLEGSTNAAYLKQKYGVSIWDEWQDSNGNLGPLYSHQWRKWGAKPDNIPQPKPQLCDRVDKTYLGVGNGSGSTQHPLGKTWEGMMARCYDRNSPMYAAYGAKGVSVCNRWLEFVAFAEDAVNLPGYADKAAYPSGKTTRYVLDKDMRGNGFVYAPETCSWITDKQNARFKADMIYTVAKDGQEYSFTDISEFCEEHGAEAKNFSDLWTGNKNAKVRSGFTFVRKEPLVSFSDQITELIDGLKNNPDSRRHVVSAWNVTDIPKMALAPCHCLFQCYVTPGEYRNELVGSGHTHEYETKPKLSLHLYQRSADVFLGVPFNIASYALLTHLLAHVCDYEVGEFVHSFGDLHLYKNHIKQAVLQLARNPKSLPTLLLSDNKKDIFAFTPDDIALFGYDPDPGISAPVAV